MSSAVLLLAALAQAPLSSQFDDGAILGRVCEDLDGDGACGREEPGVSGARVLLETGLEAVTDTDGRFHLAAVGARAPDDFAGARLQPGRHRLKIDPSSLAPGWEGTERGRTVELPMGASVLVDLALRRATTTAPTRSAALPEVRRAQGRLEYELAWAPGPGESLSIDGRAAEDGRAWVQLSPGPNTFLVAASSEGRLRLWTTVVELVPRRESALVVPGGLERLGELSWVAGGEVVVALRPGAAVSLGGAALPLDAQGQGRATQAGDEVELVLVTSSGRWQERLRRAGTTGFFAVGLLDLEANVDVRTGAFAVFGRGAAAARASFAGFKVNAEVDLRDTDVATLSPQLLLQARRVDVFARQLEARNSQLAWADASATVASNPSEGRLRLELSREGWGRLGFGSTRWFQAAADAGRAHRAVQGAFLELRTPTVETPWGAELRAVAAPAQADLLTGLVRRPMHERFESTGGSLFFLSRATVVQGSEVVRVEWRDAVTQLPLRDVHLQRLRDYTLDALSGRVLLARPLSFVAAESLLGSDPPTAGAVAVLVVDYEYLDTGGATGATLGAEVRGRAGPVSATGSVLRDGDYTLFRGSAAATLGPVSLFAETAHSRGLVEGLAVSTDGGLTSTARQGADPGAAGWAVTLRARTRGLFNRGWWDAAWRWRQAGFEDTAQVGALNQLSVRGEQPLGPLLVTALVDLRDMPDPRAPFSGARVTGRTLAGGVGYEARGWGVRLEAREFEQALTEGTRGGLTLGLSGRYRVAPWLQLRAGYRQQVLAHGGVDLSFASVGVDVKPSNPVELGLRAGWGPGLGPQAWGTLSYTRGEETWYGVQSLDADAPGSGERRLVTGVRQQVDPTTSVFVEDVSATDVAGLRLARAVGLTQRLGDALSVSARYEHGARALEGLAPSVARNAGGLTLAWERDTVRLFARGEVRDEVGASSLRQLVASGGGEWRAHRDVSVTARALWTHSTLGTQLVDRTVDATAAVAWRAGPATILGRYAYRQNWRASFDERVHVVSVQPSVRLGSRFTLGGGGHLALTQAGPIVSASVRPAVRLWEGLEVAAEGAARSATPDGGSWASLRGEAGYRFDHRFFVGAGYTAFGFSGTGLEGGATGSRDRVYLRTEVAW